MLYFGIAGTAELNAKSQNYETTEGYLLDYTLYSKGGYDAAKKKYTNDTYQLIYNFTVDGQEYKVSTDYGTGSVPEIGSTVQIKYDPDHPEEAIIVGPNKNFFLIFIGIMFTGVPLVFLLVFLSARGCFKNFRINILGVVMSLLIIVIGYGALYMITGQYSITGIFEFFLSSFSFFLLIPVFMIVVGIYALIANLFFHKNGQTGSEEIEESEDRPLL